MRATQVVLTRCGAMDDMDADLREALERHCPGVPVRRTRHAPDTLWRVADGEEVGLAELHGKHVTAVCAIGNPGGFYRTLEELGAVVQERRPFRDHTVIPEAALVADRMVVTTEKDAVRMTNAPENVLALGIALRDMGNQ